MENEIHSSLRLTDLSHGSGCGCKIPPEALSRILAGSRKSEQTASLLIGNHHSDDAAVVDIGDGRALVSTVDFFTPIVDDARDFGRIAASNAISDVYAMGGTPLTAIAVLGWPVEQLGTDLAALVIEGADEVCDAAGISLSGGHSIDSKEPFFGLSVSGIVEHAHIKANHTAEPGDVLLLTKALGTGIIAAAGKRKLATEADVQAMVQSMTALNKVGAVLGREKAVHAMTDVTGFGLLGHLIEMCQVRDLGAVLHFDRIPLIEAPGMEKFLTSMVMPDNTMRNFKAYASQVNKLDARKLQVLCDPQTSGGLLIACQADEAERIMGIIESHHTKVRVICKITGANGSHRVMVE